MYSIRIFNSHVEDPSAPDDVPCQLESLPRLVRCANPIQSEYTSCKVAEALLE